jgi:hypothetical protein
MLFVLGSHWVCEALTPVNNWRESTDVSDSVMNINQVQEFYKNDIKPNRKRFIVTESGNIRTSVWDSLKSDWLTEKK